MARRGVAGIFGEHEVDVDLDLGALAWRVCASDGRLLMQVPWRWAYDQTDLGKRVYHRNNFLTRDEYLAHNSRWEAFEVCMCAYPLTSEERTLLEARFPGITSRRQYVVADPIWQPEPRNRPTRPARNRTPPAIDTAPPVVSPPPEPPTTVETAHEAGERKLLL
jgi:hypothetical protein